MKTNIPAPSTGDLWSETVAAACGGSRAAQSRLLADLRGYLRSRAGKQLDAGLHAKLSPSDIVQETLIEGYRSFETFRGKSRAELLVWLQGIMTNQVHYARRHYRGTAKRDTRRESPMGSERSGWAPHDQREKSPSENAIANEDAARLEAALTKLPERQEQVIRLRNELRLPFDEVGLVLNCSSDAAQKLWSRAIDKLARELHYG